jgi:DivIVA domain-containing protein
MDVQQVEFRLAFRGYNERDVDAFLDRITEDLAAYMEDNQRLRAGAPAAPVVAGDIAGARTEAGRIVDEARAEAARILRDAEIHAAAAGSPAGDAPAAVAPFLNTEREFLQSLGSLVQGHAEEVKQMVLALRARTDAGAPAAAPATPAPAPALEDEVDEAEPAATSEDEAFAPVSVPAGEDEANDVAEGSVPEPAPAQLRRDSGDRSLRELFWGED